MPSLRPSWQIWKGLYAVLLDKEEPRSMEFSEVASSLCTWQPACNCSMQQKSLVWGIRYPHSEEYAAIVTKEKA